MGLGNLFMWSAWPSSEASALFFCLCLLLDANMRKITASHFPIPETMGWLDASRSLAVVWGWRLFWITSNFTCALAGRETSWTPSKPQVIRDTDKTMRASLRASTNYTAKSCIFSPQTAAHSKRSPSLRDSGMTEEMMAGTEEKLQRMFSEQSN